MVFTATVILTTATAQNWSLSGNNSATGASKLGTTNGVPVRVFTNNLERMRIDTSGNVGIGTSLPLNKLTIQLSGSTPAPLWLSGGGSLPAFIAFGEEMATGFNLATAANAAGYRPVLNTRRSRGTLAVPLAVKNNDFLASFVASGYDGSAFQNPATIDFYVDGAPSSGNVPGRISFVTGTNFANRLERLKVGSNGNFTFNDGQLTLQQSTGNLGIGTGNLNFSSSLQTIQFANPGASSNAMLTLFTSGTTNSNRMVLGHSPAYPDWGLQYSDLADDFEFLAAGTSVLHIGLGSQKIGIGTTAPTSRLQVVGAIETYTGYPGNYNIYWQC